MPSEPARAAAQELAGLLAYAREELAAVPRGLLGEVVTPRFLGIPRTPRVVLRDEVWHLGVLLIGPASLYATGEVVRAREPARRGYTADAQRERAGLAEAAYRGGILPGTAVHLGWRRIELDRLTDGADRDPLDLQSGVPLVRWSAASGFIDLDGYLRDRVALLRHPPQGAT